ncbi:MAG: MarR family transcriptional regulator [Bacteroidales bacterium]
MKNSICLMRDIVKALTEYEDKLMKIHDISLNEAMLLCCLNGEHDTKNVEYKFSASDISEKTALSASHASKVLRSAESKKLITRSLGTKDHRKMFFELTPAGHEKLAQMKDNEIEIPKLFVTINH